MTPHPVAPIFVIAAPCSGDAVLFEALGHGSGVWRSVGPGPTFLDRGLELDPDEDGADCDRLEAPDAANVGALAKERLTATLKDRTGLPFTEATGELRALAAGPHLALRVSFLATIFPDARFVYIYRDPARATWEMLAAWRSGNFVTAPSLRGWVGPPWSLPLIPGWAKLAGRPLEQVVAEQWRTITEIALDDLEGLGPERWAVADYGALLEDPRDELRRLCGFLDLEYDQAMLTPLEMAQRNEQTNAQPTVDLVRALGFTAAVAARARDLIADSEAKGPAVRTRGTGFSSVSTGSFIQALARLESSLLVSTYQTGKLILARKGGSLLNTHLRDFDRPMGIAVRGGGFAIAARTEIWDFQNMPDVARKIDPPGSHDACYLPFNRHTTGDILAHELVYAGGELWAACTAFSCLATFDAEHSFVPRWRPPFVSQLAPDDRCHLNGIAVVNDEVAYVTTLGQTDEPNGWRKDKASGGCVLDVRTSEIVATGLSMPHSPRWHQDRLWVLESGRGELGVVDLANGGVEPVIELPGFTRGLSFAGDLAFVGLSQIRESATFGNVPLTKRVQERVCGVWIVNISTAQVVGFLRFQDLVQEIFDVQLLTRIRHPEIAEPGSTAVATSFVLP